MFKKFVKAEILTWVVILIGIFFVGLGSSYFGMTFLRRSGPLPTSKTSFSNVTPAPINNNNPQQGIYNVLFLGYGGGNHEGTLLTDSIIVIHVDTNTHKASMISIPRDLWVPGNQKINAAGISGFQNSEPVVQEVTGLPMNYYVSIDFSGFTKLVDDIGGITVSVPKTFDDPFYPIIGQENNVCGITEAQINELKAKYSGFELERQFTCRYEHLHYEVGSANLDGQAALKFVRSRHGDSDFGRSLRQFSVLQGIGNKLINLRSLNKLDATINNLYDIVRTDLDLGTIKSLLQVFGDPNLYKINQIQLTTENVLSEGFTNDGEYILTPKSGNFNYQIVKDYINSQL